MGDSHQVNSLKRRVRPWGIFSRGIQPSSHQKQDGDLTMSDARMIPRIRYTPYAIPVCCQRNSYHRRDQTHGNMEREKKPPEEGLEGNRQDGTCKSSFKVTFPFSIKYDDTWWLGLIPSPCRMPFSVMQKFQYEKMEAQLFVEKVSMAFKLKKASGKISNRENSRLPALVSPSAVPHSVQKELRSEKVKLPKVIQTEDMLCTHTQTHSLLSHSPFTTSASESLPSTSQSLHVTKSKGYQVPQQAVELQRVHADPDMTDGSNSGVDVGRGPFPENEVVMMHDTEMGLNLGNCMAASLQILEENMSKFLSFNLSNNPPYQPVGLPDSMQKAPNIKSLNLSKTEVKSEGELDKVRGLDPEEMSADKNALCHTFTDKSTNISSILELFPKLLRLDGDEVPPPITSGIEASKKLPVCKGSVYGSETSKNLVMQLLQQYYWIYDNGDRQGLLEAYHDEACFSLMIPFNPEDPDPISLEKFSKRSRNMKKCKDPVLWGQLLKHTKRDVVDFISVLPRTQHDFSSFVVDVCVQTEKMLCFSVSGVFKEEGMCQPRVRAFTRLFIVTSGRNSSLCIVNDQLCVRDVSYTETQGTFSTPVPTL